MTRYGFLTLHCIDPRRHPNAGNTVGAQSPGVHEE
jgi:hypothetical protein